MIVILDSITPPASLLEHDLIDCFESFVKRAKSAVDGVVDPNEAKIENFG